MQHGRRRVPSAASPMTTVVDASAYLDLLLDVVPVEHQGVFDGVLVAPGIFHAEVASGLARCERRGVVDPAVADLLLHELVDAPVETVDVRELLPRAFELRPNLGVHDACYVALAELLECTLVTSDGRLARAPGLPVPVVLV